MTLRQDTVCAYISNIVLRARILVPVLLLSLLTNLRQLILFLLKLRLFLQPLLVSLVDQLALTRDRRASLDGGPGIHALPPFVEVLELV